MPVRPSAGLAAGFGLALIVTLASSYCASLRVPAEPPSFRPETLHTLAQEGISLGAHPLVGRDAYWEHFDDNLPEIGIVAIWVAIENHRPDRVDFSKCQWSLKTARKRYRALESSRLMDIYYDQRKIRLWSENADRNAQRDLNNIIMAPGSIGRGLGRDGFLFFRLRAEAILDWKENSSLHAQGVLLEDGRKIELSLSLSNDKP